MDACATALPPQRARFSVGTSAYMHMPIECRKIEKEGDCVETRKEAPIGQRHNERRNQEAMTLPVCTRPGSGNCCTRRSPRP